MTALPFLFSLLHQGWRLAQPVWGSSDRAHSDGSHRSPVRATGPARGSRGEPRTRQSPGNGPGCAARRVPEPAGRRSHGSKTVGFGQTYSPDWIEPPFISIARGQRARQRPSPGVESSCCSAQSGASGPRRRLAGALLIVRPAAVLHYFSQDFPGNGIAFGSRTTIFRVAV
jgi:hypothetical protein